MNARTRYSKGQIVAVFTIVLPVLLGVMALGVDFALIYFNWSMVQKAADAAALAGASQLTGVSGSASSVQTAVDNYVNGYACMNGVSDPAATYPTLCTETTHPGGFTDKIVFTTNTDTQVSVGINRTVPYYFGKMIGLNTANVSAKATAAILPPGTIPNGLFPIGLPCKSPCNNLNDLLTELSSLSNGSGTGNISLGSKFVLNNIWDASSLPATGSWGWLDVGQGKGASGLGTVLQSGSPNTYTTSNSLSPATGVGKGNSNPAQSGLSARLASCGASNPTSYDPCASGNNGAVPNSLCSNPCLVSIPVLDYSGCKGSSCTMPINGFAQMWLESDSSTTSGIDACIVTGNNCSGAEGSGSASNFGSLAAPLLIN
ncbi:MAG TPA: pilus assembly protein TadG-related protein [Candidatus Binataceae bacterium]|jgi:Flp pilus assembly protein TadG